MSERTSSAEVGLKEQRGWRLWGEEAGRGAVRGVAEEERPDEISRLMVSTLEEKNEAKPVAVSDDGSRGGGGRRRELKVGKRWRRLDDWEEGKGRAVGREDKLKMPKVGNGAKFRVTLAVTFGNMRTFL